MYKKFGAVLALALALGMTSVATSPALARDHWGGWGGYGRGYGGWGYGGLGSFAAGAALGGVLGNSLGYGENYSPGLYSGYTTFSSPTYVDTGMYGSSCGVCSPTYVAPCNTCPY